VRLFAFALVIGLLLAALDARAQDCRALFPDTSPKCADRVAGQSSCYVCTSQNVLECVTTPPRECESHWSVPCVSRYEWGAQQDYPGLRRDMENAYTHGPDGITSVVQQCQAHREPIPSPEHIMSSSSWYVAGSPVTPRPVIQILPNAIVSASCCVSQSLARSCLTVEPEHCSGWVVPCEGSVTPCAATALPTTTRSHG
jgi:hypothetical protein